VSAHLVGALSSEDQHGAVVVGEAGDQEFGLVGQPRAMGRTEGVALVEVVAVGVGGDEVLHGLFWFPMDL
jgi:hypothetical protein